MKEETEGRRTLFSCEDGGKEAEVRAKRVKEEEEEEEEEGRRMSRREQERAGGGVAGGGPD